MKKESGGGACCECFHMQNKTIVEHYDKTEDSLCNVGFDKNGWYGITMS